jgi:tetratricopeptide (TPR) repeat protein
VCYLLNGNYKKGNQLLVKAVALTPNKSKLSDLAAFIASRTNLGKLKIYEKDSHTAVVFLKEAANSLDDSVALVDKRRTLLNLSMAYNELGNTKKASQAALKAGEFSPDLENATDGVQAIANYAKVLTEILKDDQRQKIYE